MNGAKLRARLAAGEAVTMVTPHHASSGLAARLVELGADSVFVDCEHGTWSFEDVRMTAQIVRAVGGAAIVRPQSHERPLIIRYLNAGADGIMVPMVGTAAEARAIVEAVRYALPADHEKRLVVAMIETVEAIEGLEAMLAVEGMLAIWWLRRWRYGPVEWLWRWGTYGARPPLRLQGGGAAH